MRIYVQTMGHKASNQRTESRGKTHPLPLLRRLDFGAVPRLGAADDRRRPLLPATVRDGPGGDAALTRLRLRSPLAAQPDSSRPPSTHPGS